MPRGNRAILLVSLLVLWVAGVAFLTSWYVAFSGFDGYEANVLGAVAIYGVGGLIPVAILYFGIGALLHEPRNASTRVTTVGDDADTA